MASEFVAALAVLLQRCTTSTKCLFSTAKDALRRARQIHAAIVVSASRPQSPFIYNNLISAYGWCGSLVDARRMFDVMTQRNVVSYNALISALCRGPLHANAADALRLFPAMASVELRPNSSTFSSLLQASSWLADQRVGTMLHGQVVICGFSGNVCVQTALLVMYSTCGRTERADRIFGEMAERDAVAWNSIILAHARNGEVDQGLQLFLSMLRVGLLPTNFTFSIIVNASGRSGNQWAGGTIHAQIVKSGCPDDVLLHNALLDMYAGWGDLAAASAIFRGNDKRDLVSWNSLLAGYSDNGDFAKAIDLFSQLQASPEGLELDEYTFAAIISVTAALPAMIYGKPFHAQVVKRGLECSVFVGSTLLDMYFKNEELCSAKRLFDLITDKDVVLWTDMIVGHARLGEGEAAMTFFHKMLEEGHGVDCFSLCSSLNSSADLVALRQGEMIHSMVVKTGHEEDMCIRGSLVDMYAKNGVIEAAVSIFHQTANPDLKCWNSMLAGYGHHGNAEQAFQFFEEMIEQGIEPDHITFLSLLSACSHCGLVKRGRTNWDNMLGSGFVPGPKHYACMVSLLSRGGFLQEAVELILKSPFVDTFPELWRILLGSCVVFRDLHTGIQAANQVLRLDPDDSSTHILLSNLHASVGRWEAVAETRRKIRGLMLEKDPGVSWIEIRSVVHVFSADDESHVLVDDARAELQRLVGNLRGWETTEAALI